MIARLHVLRPHTYEHAAADPSYTYKIVSCVAAIYMCIYHFSCIYNEYNNKKNVYYTLAAAAAVCVFDTRLLWILLRMSKQLACRWNKR